MSLSDVGSVTGRRPRAPIAGMRSGSGCDEEAEFGVFVVGMRVTLSEAL